MHQNMCKTLVYTDTKIYLKENRFINWVMGNCKTKYMYKSNCDSKAPAIEWLPSELDKQWTFLKRSQWLSDVIHAKKKQDDLPAHAPVMEDNCNV